MSIISNEHQGPLPRSPEPAPLPSRVDFGEWSAVPNRYTQDGGLHWDLYHGSNRRLAALLDGDIPAKDLREILRALDQAHKLGAEGARREIRSALGVICGGH